MRLGNLFVERWRRVPNPRSLKFFPHSARAIDCWRYAFLGCLGWRRATLHFSSLAPKLKHDEVSSRARAGWSLPNPVAEQQHTHVLAQSSVRPCFPTSGHKRSWDIISLFLFYLFFFFAPSFSVVKRTASCSLRRP